MFDSHTWAAVPFQFWALVFFVFGSIVGSFLNVCIYRLPLGESIVSPPSHCPGCGYSIPFYLNVPLLSWVQLRGRCRNCGAQFSVRYFLVELLTATAFLGCWVQAGHRSAPLALIYALFIAGLIVATFIDFDHLIIPDGITIGGIMVGVMLSALVPSLHGQRVVESSIWQSILGAMVGMGVVYLILRLGKLFFGRHKIQLPAGSRVIFTETSLVLPNEEIIYGDLFYRDSDEVQLKAHKLELADRCYQDVLIRLTPARLLIGTEQLVPDEVPFMEAEGEEMVLPREAMGLGDVKFMGAIGAFLGWKAVLFSLMASSVIGSCVGVTLIVLGKREWSSRLPYGPYIALAAAWWIFGGQGLFSRFFNG